jgi:hypothetical protein
VSPSPHGWPSVGPFAAGAGSGVAGDGVSFEGGGVAGAGDGDDDERQAASSRHRASDFIARS